MNIVVEPHMPMPGVPDIEVIERVRRGMAGCGSCLGIAGLGENGAVDWGEGGAYVGGGGVVPASGGYGTGNFIQDITRGTLSIVSSILTPPTYRTATTPTGSLTEIRAGGALSYPGQVAVKPDAEKLSTTTLILIGAGVLMLMSMKGR